MTAVVGFSKIRRVGYYPLRGCCFLDILAKLLANVNSVHVHRIPAEDR